MCLGKVRFSLYETDSPRVIIRAYSMKVALDIYEAWMKATGRDLGGEPVSIKYLGSESTRGNVFE